MLWPPNAFRKEPIYISQLRLSKKSYDNRICSQNPYSQKLQDCWALDGPAWTRPAGNSWSCHPCLGSEKSVHQMWCNFSQNGMLRALLKGLNNTNASCAQIREAMMAVMKAETMAWFRADAGQGACEAGLTCSKIFEHSWMLNHCAKQGVLPHQPSKASQQIA